MKKKKESKAVGIDSVMDSINQALGTTVVYEYKNYQGDPVKRLRTGSIGLDIAVGGGWVYGGMNYLSGWESSGKSTLCLYAIRESQKAIRKSGSKKKCVYVDHEYTFDRIYAESLGVDVESMILTQPDTAEDGYMILLKLIESGEVDTIVFDSIASALTEREVEGEMGDSNIGVKAKLNSQAFPKLCRAAKQHNVVLMMVNQLREKIGVMFGSPVTEPGGNALRFYPSIKVELAQSTKDKTDGEITGNLVRAKVKKNKTAPPFKQAEYSIIYGEGIDRLGEILDWGEYFGMVKKAGSWYSTTEDAPEVSNIKLGQGKNGARQFLKDNPEVAEILEDLIYQMAGI
jgi:recombination protein RecA